MTLGRVLAAGAALVVVAAAAACGASGSARRRRQRRVESVAPSGGHTPSHATPPKIPLRAGERFQFLSMAKPYTPQPPPGGTDEYRCFLIDPYFTAPSFIVGSEFLPENADIVHHAILFRVEPGDVAAAKKFDAQTPGDGWTCFGDDGIRAATASDQQRLDRLLGARRRRSG